MAPGVLITSFQPGGAKVESPTYSKTSMQSSLKMAVEEDSDHKPRVTAAVLPFSVEALMADKKPSKDRDISSPTVSPLAGSSHSPRMGSLSAAETPSSPLSLNSHFTVGAMVKLPEEALVKSESPDRERSPWIQSPRFSPSPPSKFCTRETPLFYSCSCINSLLPVDKFGNFFRLQSLYNCIVIVVYTV